MSCKTCEFARWVLTKNGRINANKVGLCAYPIPDHLLPHSVTKRFGYREQTKGSVSVLSGNGCPCYVKRKGKAQGSEG